MGDVSTGSDVEWVSVDLLDEPAHVSTDDAGRQEQAGEGARERGSKSSAVSSAGRPRLIVVAAAVVALLVALVVWPESSGTSADDAANLADSAADSTTVPPPANPRLLPWPGRGPWAGDTSLVEEAATVWRTDAGALDVTAPGDEVHPLWAGPVNDRAVVLLQSETPDGEAWVAQLTESRIPGSSNPGVLRLTAVSPLLLEPPFLALSYPGGLGIGGVLDEPGAVLMQVLAAPDLVDDEIELQRVAEPAFEDVPVRSDGLSQPWVHAPWLVPGGPVVAAVRTEWPQPGIVATGLITPEQITPGEPPVQLVTPAWGRTREHFPEDYLDGLAALRSLDRSSGRVAILGSTVLEDSRGALVEVRPSGSGEPVVVTVGSRGNSTRFVSEPRPAAEPGQMVVGAARSIDGARLFVAVGPPETSVIVIGVDGAPVVTGPSTTAVWIDRDVDVSEVAAQGYRRDETWVGRTVLDVSDL